MLISPLVIHHNHKVWGADHDSYNPDNFFVKEIAERRTTYDYIPFSAGPRNCIGMKSIINQVHVILAHLDSWMLIAD